MKHGDQTKDERVRNKPAPFEPTRRQRSPGLTVIEKPSISGFDPGGGWPSIPG